MSVRSAPPHPDRTALDAALEAGQSVRDVAGQWGLSRSAVGRHKAHAGNGSPAAQKPETAPENRPKQAAGARGPDGRLTPGASGNPGGRRKGLGEYIRECTNKGRECTDAVPKVLRDRDAGHKLKMEAAAWAG